VIDRRRFISTASRAAGAFALAPALLRQEGSRPALSYGIASGDVTAHRAMVWSCTDRPSRMQVEWATTESFQDAGRVLGPVALAENGFTARVELIDLPPSQRIFYRIHFEDLSDSRSLGVPAVGSFLSAPGFRPEPGPRRDVSFAWSADTAGQGWGINRDWGGMRIYEVMRRARPDFFIHCGDTIYADSPLVPEVKLPDGTIWKNVVTPAKSKVAETLDEFRGNHLYNKLDENVLRFNAEVPQLVLWDDHEVRNNWYPQQTLESDDRYTVKSVATLSARARQAFLEHTPIRLGRAAKGVVPEIFRRMQYGPLLDVFALDLRTYRGPNSPNRQTSSGGANALAGQKQIDWLERMLLTSTATWKVIASDLPIGLIVRDGERNFEAFANGDGRALGREIEIARLLRFIRRRGIRNVVWVTADVHYAAAHRYDPDRAQFKDFNAFHEFVAGPLHAGTGLPAQLDNTFGPHVLYNSVPATLTGSPGPAAGLQFFGMVKIAAASGIMTVSLHNLAGDKIYSTDLEPQPRT
jgi:alkaline phosphatase D